MRYPTPGERRALLRERLRHTGPGSGDALSIGGLSPQASREFLSVLPAQRTPAAVLLPIVDRPDGLTVLLTERSPDLRTHAGQIAFPGGRIEPGDADAVAAALRETEEEIGLAREHVEVLGFLVDQLVITGFRVTPVVGLVAPDFTLELDPKEVASSFEVPLDYILDPAHHEPRRVEIQGVRMPFRQINYQGLTIWGMTAGVLFTLAAALAPEGPEDTRS